MSQLRIFVSHSSENQAFCDTLVRALRGAGADVWYDQHDLGAGHLHKVIMRELRSRPVFIVVLSKAAFASSWVQDECEWAYNLYKRDPNRTLLPVVAEAIEPDDFDTLMFLENFKRVDVHGQPAYIRRESIKRTLQALSLTALPSARHHSAGRSTAKGAASESGEPSAPCPPEEAQPPTQYVLLVDDDESSRVIFRQVYEEASYTVFEAGDGVEAFEVLRSNPHRLVVVLDYMMPRLDGISLLHLVAADPVLRSRHAYILLTANPHALTRAADEVLSKLSVQQVTKPVDIDDLLAVSAEAIARLAVVT